jgi:hypothetical protein
MPFLFPAQYENHVRRGQGKAFIDDIRKRSIKQLFLRSEKTANVAFRQTLRMEVVKLVVRSSIRLQKLSNSASWRSRPPLK